MDKADEINFAIWDENCQMISAILVLFSQTFCQRIIETSSQEFSETTNDYFARIINASRRMQNMISSLLDYSRTNSLQVPRTSTDLNEVFSEVVFNLIEGQENSAVSIAAETLPTIVGIPDQLKQLFTNILSNAIKYRKKNVPPEISVISEKEQDFWKITIRKTLTLYPGKLF